MISPLKNIHRKNTKLHLFVWVLTLGISLGFGGTANGQIDYERSSSNYQQVLSDQKQLQSLSSIERMKVVRFHQFILAQSNTEPKGPQFEVIQTIRGCKYFIAEQGSDYSLLEEWTCSHPSKGDTGYGDLSSYGSKEVLLNESSCTIYVDDWMLSKSSALDKLLDKCS